MEQNDENVNAIISNNIPNAIIDHPPPAGHDDHETIPTPQPSLKKKKHGTKNIFKVALFMMRGHHRKSKLLPMDDGSRSIWRKLVGSMRPLHLQDNKSPLQTFPHQPNGMITSSPSENTTDIQSQVDGFDSASEFLNSPSPASSRYASAVGLNEMVEDEKKQEEEVEEIVVVEDEMIDAKAEEFIAQFYREMKLQRLDITDRHYREISMRSLGS